MKRAQWWGILVVVVLLFGLLGGAGPVAADPPDDVLPPGLALREFIHHPKGEGRPGQISEPLCTDPTTNNTVNCDSYGYSGIHWANPSGVPYYVNPNFSAKKSPALSKAAAPAAINASFGTWDAANNRLSYSYKGTTGVKSSKYDGKNVVLWGPAYGAIAVTRVWYWTATKEIAEFDILLGNNFSWTYTVPTGVDPAVAYDDPDNSGLAGTYDVRNIMTHEAGHTLLLADLYDATDSALTMYGYGALGELKKDTLGYGDVLGVNAIYP